MAVRRRRTLEITIIAVLAVLLVVKFVLNFGAA